jgi:hypothetical protein
MALIFSPTVRPEYLLLLSFILTTVHAFGFVDFGYTRDAWYNFFAWQFVHRSYSHGLSNYMFLMLLLGAPVALSFAEISLLSAFTACLALFDPAPFYGLSGIVFFVFGKALHPANSLSTYQFLNTQLRIPYILPVLLVAWEFSRSAQLSPSIQMLHLFSFLVGAALSSSFSNNTQLTAD